MNASVKVNTVAARQFTLQLPVNSLTQVKKQWRLTGLIAAVLLSAFAVVCVANLNRELVAKQQDLIAVQEQLHNQQGELMVEQGTVSNDAAVANTAREHLGMQMPAAKNVVMVQQ